MIFIMVLIKSLRREIVFDCILGLDVCPHCWSRPLVISELLLYLRRELAEHHGINTSGTGRIVFLWTRAGFSCRDFL